MHALGFSVFVLSSVLLTLSGGSTHTAIDHGPSPATWCVVDSPWTMDAESEGQRNPNALVPLLDEKSGLYGYASRKGARISPRFMVAREFHEGYAAVKENGLWGVIDEQGRAVIEPKYTCVLDPINGLTVASLPDKGGWCIVRLNTATGCIVRDHLWTAWQKAIQASDLRDRELIVRVLDMYPEPGKRLTELANMEAIYWQMREIRVNVVEQVLNTK